MHLYPVIPAEVFPPGDYIRDELAARGWTQQDLGNILGCTQAAVNLLINNKRGITPKNALALSAAFGTAEDYWFNLDSVYRFFMARKKIQLAEIRARAARYPIAGEEAPAPAPASTKEKRKKRELSLA